MDRKNTIKKLANKACDRNDEALKKLEEPIPNGTEVTEISTGRRLKIVDAIKTNNQFGYGVYLYRFEGLTDTGFGLYRNEVLV